MTRSGARGTGLTEIPQPILYDRDVLIDYLRGHPAAIDLVKKESEAIILSGIVVAELYAGVRGATELATLDRFVALFRVVPVSDKIARIGGLYSRDYTKSHGLGLADAIVAATADAEGAELRTLNVKHYPMYRKLKPAYRKLDNRSPRR